MKRVTLTALGGALAAALMALSACGDGASTSTAQSSIQNQGESASPTSQAIRRAPSGLSSDTIQRLERQSFTVGLTDPTKARPTVTEAEALETLGGEFNVPAGGGPAEMSLAMVTTNYTTRESEGDSAASPLSNRLAWVAVFPDVPLPVTGGPAILPPGSKSPATTPEQMYRSTLVVFIDADKGGLILAQSLPLLADLQYPSSKPAKTARP